MLRNIDNHVRATGESRMLFHAFSGGIAGIESFPSTEGRETLQLDESTKNPDTGEVLNHRMEDEMSRRLGALSTVQDGAIKRMERSYQFASQYLPNAEQLITQQKAGGTILDNALTGAENTMEAFADAGKRLPGQLGLEGNSKGTPSTGNEATTEEDILPKASEVVAAAPVVGGDMGKVAADMQSLVGQPEQSTSIAESATETIESIVPLS